MLVGATVTRPLGASRPYSAVRLVHRAGEQLSKHQAAEARGAVPFQREWMNLSNLVMPAAARGLGSTAFLARSVHHSKCLKLLVFHGLRTGEIAMRRHADFRTGENEKPSLTPSRNAAVSIGVFGPRVDLVRRPGILHISPSLHHITLVACTSPTKTRKKKKTASRGDEEILIPYPSCNLQRFKSWPGSRRWSSADPARRRIISFRPERHRPRESRSAGRWPPGELVRVLEEALSGGDAPEQLEARIAALGLARAEPWICIGSVRMRPTR